MNEKALVSSRKDSEGRVPTTGLEDSLKEEAA